MEPPIPLTGRALVELAARQARERAGLVLVDELTALGVPRHRIDGLVRRGYLRRLGRGVYAVNGVPTSFVQLLAAGLAVLGPSSFVSHGAAANLHGFDRWTAEVPEFTVPRAKRSGACAPGRVHTTSAVHRLDVVRVGELRVSSPARTIVDLAAAGASAVMLESAIDSAVRAGLTTPGALRRRLSSTRGRGQRGSRQLEALLTDAGGHTRLERMFLELMRRGGMPRPETQVVHRRQGAHIARVDFLFPDSGVVVEVSGRLGHSSPTERAKDARRRNALQAIGRMVLEFTWSDVHDRPQYVLETVEHALGR